MSTESTDKLWTLWKLQELDVERAIGQMLQHLKRLDESHQQQKLDLIKLTNALTAINLTLSNLRNDVDGLIAHTAMPPPKTKKRARRTRPADKS